MSDKLKIGVIVGSLRKGSYNRMIAKELIARAPASLDCEIIEIGDLDMYNEDLDHGEAPAAWAKFRESVKSKQGIIFVTPEYNRSTPAAIKNAIDVGSRPYGQSAWAQKPAAVVSASTGATGGFGANHHLRQSLVFLDMPAMQQPEAYIGHVQTLFDDTGKMTNADTGKFLDSIIGTYAKWAAQHHK